MFNRIRGSHGTVVAYLALFAALATGGAYAADKIGSSDIKPNAVKSTHIKNGQVKAPDLAERAGFRAVAAVATTEPASFENDIVPKRGFSAVTRDAEGVYCLTPSPATGLNPATDPPLITVEYGNSAGENFTAMWDSLTGDCDVGTYEIKLYDADTGAATDDPAFVILVP